jgi:halogenation protein CepH
VKDNLRGLGTMQKHALYDVIIAGAGPAGSTAATLLAKKGHSVLVLEKERFPRYHIGESLLPATCPILDLIGLSDAELRKCFWDKNGASWYWGQENELWDVKFSELDFQRNGLHVVRSEFDQLLRNTAQKAGAEIRHAYRVNAVTRDVDGIVNVQGEDSSHCPFTVHGRYFVDATGQATLLSAPRKLKQYQPQLAHLAVWGYWSNVSIAPNLPVQTLSAAFDTGWCWFIPLRDGTVSVGIVVRKEHIETLRSRGAQQYYLECLQRNKLIIDLLKGATLSPRPIRIISDYSYESTTFTPDGHLLVGDAAAFIDPIFSVGVHLAMSAAEQAAIALDAILTGEKTIAEAFEHYQTFYKRMFTSMRTFVLFFYGMNASRADYFWKAKTLLPEALALNEREAFIALISGQGDLLSMHIHQNKHFTAERLQMLERLTGQKPA